MIVRSNEVVKCEVVRLFFEVTTRHNMSRYTVLRLISRIEIRTKSCLLKDLDFQYTQ